MIAKWMMNEIHRRRSNGSHNIWTTFLGKRSCKVFQNSIQEFQVDEDADYMKYESKSILYA